MKRKSIRIITILGAIAIAGIVTVQLYWMQQAWSTAEKQFNQSVLIALQKVANKIFEYNNVSPSSKNPVNQLSSSYFVVNTNSEIDPNVLEHYLITEFDLHNLHLAFEYGIYNCTNDKMVYGKYISFEHNEKKEKSVEVLPKYDEYVYYFGVNFPSKQKYILNSLSIWIVFSAILLLVVIFFSYAIFIILKQRRLSEQQRDFINNMTHEFKTPISSINISADVLLNPENINDSKRLNTYAGLIKQETQRLNSQVEKVLNLASIEKKGKPLHVEIFDASKLLCEIVESLDLNKNATIKINTKATNSTIKADKLHFTNIVFNLVDNAIKYSGEKPEIEIITENCKNCFCFCISDKGKGIAKEEHKKIFKKFYRIPTGNIHDVKGFGLGLYYVKTICKLHNWKIELNSNIDKGTTIKIKIPLLNE